jgi:hypothetical protein
MMNTYRAFEVASGFEPLYEVLQTTAQPLGYATVLKRRKDNNLFLNNANLLSKKIDFFRIKVIKGTKENKSFQNKSYKRYKENKSLLFLCTFCNFCSKKNFCSEKKYAKQIEKIYHS